jgi:LuxR family maltose regulon positive regulatory protein
VLTPLISTKLYLPPPRPNLVSRPRLVKQLNAGASCKLILISAPAGFGKTTLLYEWISGRELPLAWFSIDSNDNDPIRFWAYVIAALQTIEPEIGVTAFSALQTPQPPAIEALVAELINDIAESANHISVLSEERRLILVLDDYHLITETQVHDSMVFFLDNLPPRMQLILSGRSDPPWPLARVRARQELTEIRIRDLRFTIAETKTLLNRILKFNLTADDIARLENRTEGWAAGLQMAAISIRGRENISDFIEDFAGSNRFVFDYLVEEVLASQTPQVTDFLLKTSILERLSASLCDELLGSKKSSKVLWYLDQANLFLNPLDDKREWYSYHRLFGDLLRTQLEQLYPQQIPGLHSKACKWLTANDRIMDAISHAVQGGDHEQIATLTEQHALEMVHHRELKTLQNWLDALPNGMIAARPWLSVAYAWVLVNAWQFENLENYLRDAEDQKGMLGNGERERLLGHIYAIRAYYHGQNGEYLSAVKAGQKALLNLPENDTARSWTSIGIAHNWRRLGDLATAENAYRQAIEINAAIGNEQGQPHALVGLANVLATNGKLHQAISSYQSILQLIQKQAQKGKWFPIQGFVHSCLGSVYLEWNDLEKASHHTRLGVNLSERWGQIDFLLSSYNLHVFTLLASGDVDEAKKLILKMDLLMSELPEWPRALVTAYKIRFLLLQGENAKASALAQESSFHHTDEFKYEHTWIYIVLARILIATERFEQALTLLVRLLAITETAGAMRSTIEILVLQALTLYRLNELDQARSVIKHALTLAEPEGYVRTFISEGEIMADLLSQVIRQDKLNTYARKLLNSLSTERQYSQIRQVKELVESLTPREIEILQLLTTNMSVPEIAQELVVSANTVRSHVKNIYDKLAVNRRSSAVQKAKELHLV